jgi:hypothetical protein
VTPRQREANDAHPTSAAVLHAMDARFELGIRFDRSQRLQEREHVGPWASRASCSRARCQPSFRTLAWRRASSAGWS